MRLKDALYSQRRMWAALQDSSVVGAQCNLEYCLLLKELDGYRPGHMLRVAEVRTRTELCDGRENVMNLPCSWSIEASHHDQC